MRPSYLFAASGVLVVVLLSMSMLVAGPVVLGKREPTAPSTTTVTKPSIVTMTHTVTTTLTDTTTNTLTTATTKTESFFVTVTKSMVSSSTLLTSTTSASPDPRLVRANGYFLSTPLDMMDWNQSAFSSFVQHLISSNISYLYVNLPNINPDGSDSGYAASYLTPSFHAVTFQRVVPSAPVPEPGTLSMLIALALAGIPVVISRRRLKASTRTLLRG